MLAMTPHPGYPLSPMALSGLMPVRVPARSSSLIALASWVRRQPADRAGCRGLRDTEQLAQNLLGYVLAQIHDRQSDLIGQSQQAGPTAGRLTGVGASHHVDQRHQLIRGCIRCTRRVVAARFPNESLSLHKPILSIPPGRHPLRHAIAIRIS